MCAIVWRARVSAAWQGTGGTPLFVASHSGHVGVVRALVQAGAAVNQARVRDDSGGGGWMGDRSVRV